MIKILVPKEHNPQMVQMPTYFLAGPVKGGGNWQFKAIQELQKHLQDFYVAVPFRILPGEPFYEFVDKGTGEDFPRQTLWERHFLSEASQFGSIIFWLPCEDRSNPRPGGDYARDTRGELGEWRGRMIGDSRLKVVVGAEAGFPGLSQIKANFDDALGEDFVIYPTLEDTVKMAVQGWKNMQNFP